MAIAINRFWRRFGVGALVLILLLSGMAWFMYTRVVLAAKATLYALPLVAIFRMPGWI